MVSGNKTSTIGIYGSAKRESEKKKAMGKKLSHEREREEQPLRDKDCEKTVKTHLTTLQAIFIKYEARCQANL
jgi:hypothetical protein